MNDSFELKKNGLVVAGGEINARLLVTLGDVVKFDSGPIVTAPPPPSLPEIDYNDPKYDVPYQHILGVPGTWAVFPNGIPANWDVDKWIVATGRADPRGVRVDGPDRSGFDLGGADGEGLVRVNHLIDGERYLYRYTIRPGTKQAEIYVFGAAGTQVLEVNGKVGAEGRKNTVPAIPGSRTFSVRVKTVGGEVAVQLRQN